MLSKKSLPFILFIAASSLPNIFSTDSQPFFPREMQGKEANFDPERKLVENRICSTNIHPTSPPNIQQAQRELPPSVEPYEHAGSFSPETLNNLYFKNGTFGNYHLSNGKFDNNLYNNSEQNQVAIIGTTSSPSNIRQARQGFAPNLELSKNAILLLVKMSKGIFSGAVNNLYNNSEQNQIAVIHPTSPPNIQQAQRELHLNAEVYEHASSFSPETLNNFYFKNRTSGNYQLPNGKFDNNLYNDSEQNQVAIIGTTTSPSNIRQARQGVAPNLELSKSAILLLAKMSKGIFCGTVNNLYNNSEQNQVAIISPISSFNIQQTQREFAPNNAYFNNDSNAFLFAAYSGNVDLMNLLLDKYKNNLYNNSEQNQVAITNPTFLPSFNEPDFIINVESSPSRTHQSTSRNLSFWNESWQSREDIFNNMEHLISFEGARKWESSHQAQLVQSGGCAPPPPPKPDNEKSAYEEVQSGGCAPPPPPKPDNEESAYEEDEGYIADSSNEENDNILTSNVPQDSIQNDENPEVLEKPSREGWKSTKILFIGAGFSMGVLGSYQILSKKPIGKAERKNKRKSWVTT